MYKDPEKQKKYQRDWNAQRSKTDYFSTRRKRRRAEMRAFIDSLKTNCVRCGYAECKSALEFHHRDGTEKEGQVSDISRHGWSRERILKEVDKCDVLCANCHRLLGCRRHTHI